MELLLDGGGIRGYWSILALEKLMYYIALQEEEIDKRTSSSFSPRPYPHNVSHLPVSSESQRETEHGSENGEVGEVYAIELTRRYLPCHYFDYVCGSSTGA